MDRIIPETVRKIGELTSIRALGKNGQIIEFPVNLSGLRGNGEGYAD